MYYTILYLLFLASSLSAQEVVVDGPGRESLCKVPPHPDNGIYVTSIFNSKPGDLYDNLALKVVCHRNYVVEGLEVVFCLEGWWARPLPKCAPSSSRSGDGSVNRSDKKCVLPAYPDRGWYISSTDGKPGDIYDMFALHFVCQENHTLVGPESVICYDGLWDNAMPECIPASSTIVKDARTHERRAQDKCILPQAPRNGDITSHPDGQPGDAFDYLRVQVSCHQGYTLNGSAKNFCVEGNWSASMAQCFQCGTLPPKGKQLILNGKVAKLGDMPWHVAIYRATRTPYQLVCGGTLISSTIVLSAAHCFWDANQQAQLPASDYVVKVGNVYREFNSTLEQSQRVQVNAINLPVRFRGKETNYQEDIAVVELSKAIDFQSHVLPVCVDFDPDLEESQLQPGNKGKIAGWGLTTEDGVFADELRVVDMPFVPIEQCYRNVPRDFVPLITSDKICAGYENGGTALCKGDSGGGLVFIKQYKTTSRYYLRGIASTAPTSDQECNAYTYNTFTWLAQHEAFIKRFWQH